MHWTLASSFIYEDADIGVLTASRVVPVASCTQRSTEPLMRIPKSAVLTWLRLANSSEMVLVANMHAINFVLTLDAYRAQFDALAAVLRDHRGPIILAGDLNTWSEARHALVRDITARLGLVEVEPRGEDRRARFLGQPVDRVFVRGLEVVSTQVDAVESSDHNPVQVVLRALRP